MSPINIGKNTLQPPVLDLHKTFYLTVRKWPQIQYVHKKSTFKVTHLQLIFFSSLQAEKKIIESECINELIKTHLNLIEKLGAMIYQE